MFRSKLAADLNIQLSRLNQEINKLTQEKSLMQAILNNMIEAVIAVDKRAIIRSINPSAAKIFNVSGHDAPGKFFLEVIPNNDIFEVIDSVLRGEEFISREITVVLPVQKTFQVNASSLFSDGAISGCVVVLHDTSEIRALEKMRSDFLANVSHELKTPLTSIKGFVETLLEGAWQDRENSRDFLKIIQRHSEQLEGLINDLLDLSYIESKEIILRKEKFGLKELWDEVSLAFSSQINKKNIAIFCELPVELSVTADKERLAQVLTNLLDNAIKFNKDKGTIKIYAQDLGDKLKITIEDTGIGIPQKDISRVFERFYRADKARSRELGGSGLGLSIVKHIMELHAGSVGVESTEGLGSKFSLFLPK